MRSLQLFMLLLVMPVACRAESNACHAVTEAIAAPGPGAAGQGGENHLTVGHRTTAPPNCTLPTNEQR